MAGWSHALATQKCKSGRRNGIPPPKVQRQPLFLTLLTKIVSAHHLAPYGFLFVDHKGFPFYVFQGLVIFSLTPSEQEAHRYLTNVLSNMIEYKYRKEVKRCQIIKIDGNAEMLRSSRRKTFKTITATACVECTCVRSTKRQVNN